MWLFCWGRDSAHRHRGVTQQSMHRAPTQVCVCGSVREDSGGVAAAWAQRLSWQWIPIIHLYEREQGALGWMRFCCHACQAPAGDLSQGEILSSVLHHWFPHLVLLTSEKVCIIHLCASLLRLKAGSSFIINMREMRDASYIHQTLKGIKTFLTCCQSSDVNSESVGGCAFAPRIYLALW